MRAPVRRARSLSWPHRHENRIVEDETQPLVPFAAPEVDVSALVLLESELGSGR
jgi:hypothetical protein